MSVDLRDEARRLLPRWRDSRIASVSAEVTLHDTAGATPSLATIDQNVLEEPLAAWKESPSFGTAADVVNVGVMLGAHEAVREPAEYLIHHAGSTDGLAVRLARRVLGWSAGSEIDPTPRGDPVSVRSRIAAMKAGLIVNPRDPLLLLDLGRAHAMLGQTEKAGRAVCRALALAPENRLVLRSSSRFYVHAEQLDRAHEVLRRSRRVRHDPWVLAAEVSASMVAGRTSPLVKIGRDLLERRVAPPLQLSELAGALGSLELSSGNRKAARKLFAMAMVDPTENALAQAQYLKDPLGLDHLPGFATIPRAFEARARAALSEANWIDVVEASEAWLTDEPFSSSSAIIGGFAASTGLQDFRRAADISHCGLKANPQNAPLRNNLVYSLAWLGEVHTAIAAVQRADVTSMNRVDRIAWTATIGLLNYRMGDSPQGAKLYTDAIDAALHDGDDDMAALASLNWALIALDSTDTAAPQIMERALALSEGRDRLSVKVFRERLIARLAGSRSLSG